MPNESVFLPVRNDGGFYRSWQGFVRVFNGDEAERYCTATEQFAGCLPFHMVEYVPLKTAYWLVVQSKNPTSVTVHRCSNPECRLTTYAHRLPPYCQECGSKMLGKAREDDDKYILRS